MSESTPKEAGGIKSVRGAIATGEIIVEAFAVPGAIGPLLAELPLSSEEWQFLELGGMTIGLRILFRKVPRARRRSVPYCRPPKKHSPPPR